MENSPDLWQSKLPRRTSQSHKYDFGHAVITGARKLTGATRLAAEGCARIGAGLTTVIADSDVASIYRGSLPAHIMVEDSDSDFKKHFIDERRNALLIGPGAGSEFAATRQQLEIICKTNRATVIDADALNALAEQGQYEFLHSYCVLTPHEGEFTKLFPDIKGNREDQAKAAAALTKSVVVLKGAETIIAAPDGKIVINKNAAPWLATAGTGDVLAGMIAGLLAQKMEPFDAACVAVWIHGECAKLFGPGLVASDLPDMLPLVLGQLIT